MRWPTLSIFLLGLSFSVQAQSLDMPEAAVEEAEGMQQQAVHSGQKTHVQSLPQSGTPGSFEVNIPGRGMSMGDVETRFGTPINKIEEVGEPPITRWVYSDFMVYFEYQFVIHAVVTRTAP